MSCLEKRKFGSVKVNPQLKPLLLLAKCIYSYGEFLHLNCKLDQLPMVLGLAKLLEVFQRTFTFQLGQNNQQINMAGVTANWITVELKFELVTHTQ